MCKSFGVAVNGPALKWLGSLKPWSIDNFSTFVNKFYYKFIGSHILEKQTSDLYDIIQKPGEPIRKGYNCLNEKLIRMKDLDT